jgi:hypothetical protein
MGFAGLSVCRQTTKKQQADKHTQETTKLMKKNRTGKTQMETCGV